MINNNEFGIVIPTYIGDIQLTKALLASIKMFCPDVPICIIRDGDFDISSLIKTYNITHVITKETTKNQFLKDKCFKSIYSKMVAFWEGPFEKFLCLDADCVLWGDIVQKIKSFDADFIYNNPHEDYAEFKIKKYYFDFDKLFNYLPAFSWRGCHFFNAGVFVSKKKLLSIEELEYMYNLWKNDNKIIFRDQGILNYKVFYEKEHNNIKTLEMPLQCVVGVFSKNDLEEMFKFKNDTPQVESPIILHWAGNKPHFRQNDTYNYPMIYFRKMHLKYTKSIWRYFPELYFRIEELIGIYNVYYKGKYKKIFKRIILGKAK